MSNSVPHHRRQPTRLPPYLGFSRQEHCSGVPFPSILPESEKGKWSRSVVCDSLRPHGLQPTRLLRPWDFPGKSTGVGCHCLLHFPGDSGVKNPPAKAGAAKDAGLIPGLGRSPGKGNGNPIQYSCLENPMDRGTWWATVYGVTKELDMTEQLNSSND